MEELRSMDMFSDKDIAQMDAIDSVCPRFCTWNIRHAVDRKLCSKKAAQPPQELQFHA